MTIRFGLEMIGSLGGAAAGRIVEERGRGGRYASLDDFARRAMPGRDEAEALVGAGALDLLSPELCRSEKLMRLLSVQAAREGGDGGVRELFPSEASALPLRRRRAESGRRLLESEMRYLGTTLSVHPLALWPAALARERSLGRDIPGLVGRRIELVGWPITAKPVLTAGEEAMEFVSFEDETALFETVLFPDEYEAYHHLLYEQGPLLLRGLVEEDRGAVTVTISSIAKI